jgi:hypothetical protein
MRLIHRGLAAIEKHQIMIEQLVQIEAQRDKQIDLLIALERKEVCNDH